MSRLRRLIKTPRRLARSKGFGVHSPFAYSFIRDTIRCRNSYYAYTTIEELAYKSECRESDLKLIFRIACRFDITRFAVYGKEAAVLKQVLSLTRHDSECVATYGDCVPQMAVADCTTELTSEEMTQLRRTVSAGGVVVLVNVPRISNTLARVTAGMTRGMSFAGRRTAIVAGFSYLPRQHFDIII